MSRIHAVHSVASLAEASGGPSRVIPALAGAVARAGGAVTLVTRDDGRPAVASDPDVATRRTGGGWDRFGQAVAEALAVPPSILHDHGIWSAANRAACRAARTAGRPYIVNPHGMLEPWAMAHHRWRKRAAWSFYQQRLLDGAAALVATAEPERASIRARFPRSPIALVANGVAVGPLPVRDRRDDGPATVLFLSRLHPVKNLPGLLDAWARIAADPALDRWTLRIAGPDEDGHAAVVRARVAALGLKRRVELTGPVAEGDKAHAFAAADLFVLPSFTENFGIVAAEALAHGVPVIATTGTPWSALPRRDAGWWVGLEPDAMADALADAMRRPAAERAAMGVRGHAWVADAFGWPAIGEQMLGVYEWLLHGGRRPDCVDA